MMLTAPRLAWLGAGAFVAAVIAANAHLAYVAFASRPVCVAHAKVGSGAAAPALVAAKSSC